MKKPEIGGHECRPISGSQFLIFRLILTWGRSRRQNRGWSGSRGLWQRGGGGRLTRGRGFHSGQFTRQRERRRFREVLWWMLQIAARGQRHAGGPGLATRECRKRQPEAQHASMPPAAQRLHRAPPCPIAYSDVKVRWLRVCRARPRLAEQPAKVFRFPIVIGCGGRQN